MAGKRKRARPAYKTEGHQKRQRITGNLNLKDPVIKKAVLAQYYPHVFCLRDYLLSKLPATSRARRKKLLSAGRKPGPDGGEGDCSVANFLEQTLIGVLQYDEVSPHERDQQWISFSQRADTSDSAFANLSGMGVFSQAEIVDFAIWLLFSKTHASSDRVQHLLCQGFRKDISSRSVHRDENANSAIPGLLSIYPNSHVALLKASPWPQILALMGKEGERAMIELILDHGIFLPIGSGRGSYHQLSGHPLSELPTLADKTRFHEILASKSENKLHARAKDGSSTVHSAGKIIFVRNRILYARAALNARGGVRFGLRHIHVLNRYPYRNNPDESTGGSMNPNTTHVMMYMFPRQFGLHNVFTSEVDERETVQPLQDYTLRENEINKKLSSTSAKIPRRLRGVTSQLVQKLQIQHSRCAYKFLLEYYCPVLHESSHVPMSNQLVEKTDAFITTPSNAPKSIYSSLCTSPVPSTIVDVPRRKISMMEYATSTARVSAFCRAVFSRLIPRAFWGIGEEGKRNLYVFYRNVDRFITRRRFENFSLHEVSQDIKVTSMEWLNPPESLNRKLSPSDLNKRLEIFHEFLYYLFDSLLIPLIRANFHVTESSIHRYRLFFFRHDVWRSLAEPTMATLKLNMFEEMDLSQAEKILDSRNLGFSQLRLLPKETGVRPIMNLRRRPFKKGHKKVLGSSINSVLAPVYNVLTLEKTSNPDRLGSSLFSVGDFYTKLKSFKASLRSSSTPLYFAKVDVKAAFDTIPQTSIIQLMSSLPLESEYRISRHVEIKPGDCHLGGRSNGKPMRKWAAHAKAPDDFQNFDEHLESDLAVGRKNTVFVENIVNQFRDKDELLGLLAEHVQHNMVKIGKKFYRQKEGIPQGSVLSSLLCNYFYADLEAHHLQFLQSGNSLLLRLIDDFLLITMDLSHAQQFLQIMHNGLPSYGVQVNPDKTLVNFEAVISGKKIARLVGNRNFPYCGSFIDTETLNITRDRERRKEMEIADSLTVEYSRQPGKTFQRKVLNAFKIQSHAMFLDTSHNSLRTVLSNIYSAFAETAAKLHAYTRCLPRGKQPSTKLVMRTITDLVEVAFVLMKGKGRNRRSAGYECAVKKVQVEWLAIGAFREVLGRRQSKYGEVITWLDERKEVLQEKQGGLWERMGRVAP